MFSEWCNKWQMKINISKSKLVTFNPCRSLPSRQYVLNNVFIEKVSSYKYLGVTFSEDLSWNRHISIITSSACSTLGFLRQKLFLASRDVKLTAYKTFVRPKLEYANTIWWPQQAYLVDSLEAVQNKAARFISRNFLRSSSISTIKSDLFLRQLAVRATINRLTFFHSIYYSNSPERELYIKTPHFISRRHDHTRKVQPIYARTNKYQYSPLCLSITNWNALPEHVASDTNPTSFLRHCKAIM